MKLYVVRHGESENNLNKCWTGWMDVNLTEKGYEDAKCAGAIIENVKFDKVYSSDLKRAVDTAKTALPGYEIEKTSLIREINVGKCAGKTFAECNEKYEKEMEISRQTGGYDSLGGESKEEFTYRLKKFMDIVAASGHENVAAFAHGGVLRNILNIVLQTGLPRGKMLCKNCALAIFEFDGESWYVDSWINLQ